ncbi:MAG: carbon-nitrogen hydrolase family protein [bacterium]|nr:carbon-nitrogen hydrolase family protein [bacterium]
MKIAAIQMNSTLDRDANIASALELMTEAVRKGAELLVLPEVFNSRGDGGKLEQRAEPIPGPTTDALSEFAVSNEVAIIAGSIIEKSEDGAIYNTSAVIDASGAVAATYRKINLFDAQVGNPPIKESRLFSKGKDLTLVEINGWQIGLAICFDMRFPELFAEYRRAGAEVIVVPSAFTTPTGEAHWETLLRARAIETQCYIIAPNQCGVGAGATESYGHSLIVDPWGKVLKEGSEKSSEAIITNISKKRVQEVRIKIPIKL